MYYIRFIKYDFSILQTCVSVFYLKLTLLIMPVNAQMFSSDNILLRMVTSDVVGADVVVGKSNVRLMIRILTSTT